MAFLAKAVQKLSAQSSRKHTDLREACQSLLDEVLRQLGNTEQASETTEEKRFVVSDEESVLRLFRPFILACDTKVAKLVVIALDTIQKLIQNSYVCGTVRGNLYDSEAPPKTKPHIDMIVNTVCHCFEEVPDDSVQYHIIQALVAAVVRSQHPVHETGLINAVRTCYNIHLVSRNPENQDIAKTALSQMLSTVVKRMSFETTLMRNENSDEGAKASERSRVVDSTVSQDESVAPETATNGADNSNDNSDTTNNMNGSIEPSDGVVAKRQTANSRWDANFIPGKFAVHVDVSKDDSGNDLVTVRGTITLAGETAESFGEGKQTRFCQLISTASEAPPKDVHVIEVADADVSSADAPQGVVVRFSVVTKGPEEAGDMQMRLLEAVSDEGNLFSPKDVERPADAPSLVYQRDTYLLLRVLCKISMRQPDAQSDHSIESKSKVLSLELLLALLSDVGPEFFSFQSVIKSVRTSLMTSLLRNVVSSELPIFALSVKIFALLTKRLRHKLKTEIQVFFENIFLRTLESLHSSYEQKTCILRVLPDLVCDGQLLVDLFLNYDCEMESVDLFESLVNALSKVARVNHASELTPLQDQRLRREAAKGMVSILATLHNWIERCKHKDDQVQNEDEPSKEDNENKADSAETTETTQNGGGGDRETAQSQMQISRGKKLERAKIVQKFNLGDKKFFEMLLESGLAEQTPESIANFLRQTPGLSCVEVGEYIGKNKEFNISVMHSYVESFNFRGLSFDASLRSFLGSFWLPGEAQVVDRIMEKWGDVYCSQNNNFNSSDTAFVLAFSTLMLNTDLHSGSIKKESKMTKEQFISTNRGINKTEDGEDCDLDPQFLSELYDNVKSNEIKVLKAQPGSVPQSADANAKQRQSLFAQETLLLAQRTEETLKKTNKVRKHQKNIDEFIADTDPHHARPMFEVCSWPMLGAFSQLLELSDDMEVIRVSLKGFEHAIHIASRFGMDTERDAYTSSLGKFTYLDTLREMSSKNIEAVKTMLDIGSNNGNFLRTSWYDVLRTLSQLQKLHLVSSGAHSDSEFLSGEEGHDGGRKGAVELRETLSIARPSKVGLATLAITGMSFSMNNMFSGRTSVEQQKEEEKALQEQNAFSVGEHINEAVFDQVFSESQGLSDAAVVFFVQALCRVSQHELDGPVPRVFSLQKIVEISYFNMDRSRLVWRRIWEAEGKHFIHAACHPNSKVAMYAIDSLRQLAHKFLEKGELGNYQFQKEFLQPFAVIIAKNDNPEIRELVLQCVENMLLSRTPNIKSGWKSVFNVCSFAATVSSKRTVALGFSIVDHVMKHFDRVHDFFVDCVNCLISYCANTVDEQMSLDAIAHVKFCAVQLAEGKIQVSQTGSQRSLSANLSDSADMTDEEEQVAVKLWFPLFTGLSTRISSDPRPKVCSAALSVLFTTLETHGNRFTSSFWRYMFRGVLFPMFDDVRYIDESGHGGPGKEQAWLDTALRNLVALYRQHYNKLNFMLPQLLTLLSNCINQVSEKLSNTGFVCLTSLVEECGSQFDHDVWQLICDTCNTLFTTNTPFRLETKPQDSKTPTAESGDGSATQEQSEGGETETTEGQTRDGELSLESVVDVTKGVRLNQNGDLEGEFGRVRFKCLVQLELAVCVGKICFKYHRELEQGHLTALLDLLWRSFSYAEEFNKQIAFRVALQRAGLLKDMRNQLPSLLKQEVSTLSQYITVCKEIVLASPPSPFAKQVEPRLFAVWQHVADVYIAKDAHVASIPTTDRDIVRAEQYRELVAWNDVVIGMIKTFDQLPPDLLDHHLPPFLNRFFGLIACENRELRETLRNFLTQRVHLNTTPPP